MSRASMGWDDTGKAGGKGIDALAKEWAEVGVRLKADRPKFPATAPRGQSMFVRDHLAFTGFEAPGAPPFRFESKNLSTRPHASRSTCSRVK